MMILRITSADVSDPHSLKLSFNDGTDKVVDVSPLLEGPVFESLKDPEYCRQVSLDTIYGTVVWPNGADFAPEALYELAAEARSSAQ